MSEASRPPIEVTPDQSAEIGRSFRETADATLELVRSDEGIQASGLVLGAAGGLAVAKFVEGMPTQPTKSQVHESYVGGHTRDGAPPMANVTRVQEATIAGGLGLGLAAAVLYTSMRAHKNNR